MNGSNRGSVAKLIALFVFVSALLVSRSNAEALHPIAWQPGKTRVLIIAGGSSHDFKKWFEDYDTAVLNDAGFSVNATEDPAIASAELKKVDVAIISTNKPEFDTADFRKAMLAYVASGKGTVMLHPATWYNFEKWPEFNATLIGGGTRSHDAIAPFTVAVLKKDHPVMAGIPATFHVTDELYHINPDPQTLPADTVAIDVLAETSPSKKYKVRHPSVWVPKSSGGRIVCIAPGHDGRVHELEPFQKLLVNAVKWVAEK